MMYQQGALLDGSRLTWYAQPRSHAAFWRIPNPPHCRGNVCNPSIRKAFPVLAYHLTSSAPCQSISPRLYDTILLSDGSPTFSRCLLVLKLLPKLATRILSLEDLAQGQKIHTDSSLLFSFCANLFPLFCLQSLSASIIFQCQIPAGQLLAHWPAEAQKTTLP